MADISLKTVASGYNLSNINDNFNTLEDAVNTKLLNLADGNNTMGQELDMNSHKILNLADAEFDKDAVNLSQVLKVVAQAGIGGQGGIPGFSTDIKFFTFTGDGTETDFPLVGADVSDANFYDTYLDGVGQEPTVDYNIIMGATPADTLLRFATAPASGAVGWSVLRGGVLPYSGPAPITTVNSTVNSTSTSTTINNTSANNLLVVTGSADVTITISKNSNAATDWVTGDFFSVIQMGTGKVTIAIEAGGTLYPSPLFLCKTRGQYSIISATNIGADTNQWAVSGDLLPASTAPETHALVLNCTDEDTTTLAVASNVYRFYMPYSLLITEVRATVNTAQAAGTPLAFDIKMDGVSIFSSLLTIENGENKSTDATTPYVLNNDPNVTVLTDGSLISVDISQVGTAAAKGLKIYLIGQRAS